MKKKSGWKSLRQLAKLFFVLIAIKNKELILSTLTRVDTKYGGFSEETKTLTFLQNVTKSLNLNILIECYVNYHP